MDVNQDRKQLSKRSPQTVHRVEDFDFDAWAVQVRQKMMACLKKRSEDA
ncbi:MAG: hypothetical protein ACFB8W_18185 [Elainellaceae cyanobacterium]